MVKNASGGFFEQTIFNLWLKKPRDSLEIAIVIVLGIAIGIAIGIVWKSVALRPGNPLGPSLTTGKNPIMLRMFGEPNK